MPEIENQKLYNQVKYEANNIYNKPSAYKSGWIVKTYKHRGGTYKEDNKPKNLQRWFNEDWGDIGYKEYPVYRPFKRVDENTPLTAYEIDPEQAKEQIKLKQIIKGSKNLPPFKSIGKGFKELILINNVPENNEIWKWSNPLQVRKMADKYLGEDIPIYLSNKKGKKYMVQDLNGKWIHFGQLKYQDFTQHKNLIRRKSYLARTSNMKGNWKDNPYSANNLSRNILW